MKFDIESMEPILRLIVKAVEKGVGEDIREYLASTDKATNNAVPLMRADNINTNLRDGVASDDVVELKYFKRSAWTGCLLIDRENQVTYTICTEQTLDGIPKKPNRRIPHYLQTILYIQNGDIEPRYKQQSLFEMFPDIIQFSDEDYQEDYKSIMGDELSFGDEYRHLVVVYETEYLAITSIALKMLDKDFHTAQEYSLESLLRPDFSELTAVTEKDSKEEKKDSHSLVSVKAGLKRTRESEPQKETKISAKKVEEKKQA